MNTNKIEDGIVTGRFAAIASSSRDNNAAKNPHVGSLVHRTKSGLPVLLLQADKLLKETIAAIYSCEAVELENESGQMYVRLYDESTLQEVGTDAAGEKTTTTVDGSIITEALKVKGANSVTMSFTNLRLRPYLITNPESPAFGQERFELTGDLLTFDAASAKKFNVLHFPAGSFEKPKARPAYKPGAVAAAAATQMTEAAVQQSGVTV